MQTPAGWQFAIRLETLTDSVPKDVLIDRHLVLLLRDGGEVLALQGTCPHQFARLSQGTIVRGWLECPHHRARFRLADGACGSGWHLPPLKRYATLLHEGAVLLPDPLVPLS